MKNNDDPLEFMLALIFGAFIASAVLAKVIPQLGAWLLSHLIGWGVLVPDPVIAVPGTTVGLDAARLAILFGVLVAAIGLAGRRRRGEEQR